MEKTPSFQVQAFGDYYLLERIAVGGMAEIFKARQVGVRGFEKIIVIKRILHHLSEDPEFVEMFEDEAKIAAQLTQANIVQIYELGEVNETLYIAMEFVDGKNLRDVTKAATAKGLHLSVDQCVTIIIETLKGLDYAHRKTDSSGRPLAIIHRDMSPQNIIVSYEGETKILDFGIAKAASKISKTEIGVLKGKFSYMSPEQAAGKLIDQTSDLYATGVMFHEILTSERLFRAKSDIETLERVKEGLVYPPSEKNDQVPKELDDIVLRALAKNSRDRYASASEMLADLTRFAIDHKIGVSAQEISAFMKSLFAETIDLERARLKQALNQIPQNPVDPLTNAKTNITFKRTSTPSRDDETLPPQAVSRNEGRANREESQQTKGLAILLGIILILASGVFWIMKHPAANQAPAKTEEPVEDLIERIPEPVKPIEFPEPKPAGSTTKPLDKKSLETNLPDAQKLKQSSGKQMNRILPDPRQEPAPSPNESQVKRERESPLRYGTVNFTTVSGEFAQLFINNQGRGTVPGREARGMKLAAGRYFVRCETAKTTYSGHIIVPPNEEITVRCQDLH